MGKNTNNLVNVNMFTEKTLEFSTKENANTWVGAYNVSKVSVSLYKFSSLYTRRQKTRALKTIYYTSSEYFGFLSIIAACSP
jgi:hypothetical protein